MLYKIGLATSFMGANENARRSAVEIRYLVWKLTGIKRATFTNLDFANQVPSIFLIPAYLVSSY